MQIAFGIALVMIAVAPFFGRSWAKAWLKTNMISVRTVKIVPERA
jgi:hypothetical protein